MKPICTEPDCGAVAVGKTGLCAAHFAGFELDLDDSAGMAEREEQARWAAFLVEVVGTPWSMGLFRLGGAVLYAPSCPSCNASLEWSHSSRCTLAKALRAVGLA